jgi:molybdopterin molybdotransferase
MTLDSSTQRISRLTPLCAILALIEARAVAVPSRKCPLAAALGATLAEDIATSNIPPHPIALRDGFAVTAAATADASAYAPLPLASAPRRIDAGEPLPGGTDAVAPLEAVTLRGDRAEAIAAMTPGEGVLPAGGDVSAPTPLCRAGQRLRDLEVAILTAAGIAEVPVRKPRIRIVCGGAKKTPFIDAALTMLAQAVTAAGGIALDAYRDAGRLSEALEDLEDDGADAVFAIGGTGSGRNDASVQTLAQIGSVAAHGIALSPGETAAFGFAGARPVLLIPGRIDAVLAIWLLLGRQIVAKLAGGSIEDGATMLPLKRKVASTIGLTELVPVTCAGGVAEPLGRGYLSFAMLARSDGWIAVPADSEGFAVGAQVAVRLWP